MVVTHKQFKTKLDALQRALQEAEALANMADSAYEEHLYDTPIKEEQEGWEIIREGLDGWRKWTVYPYEENMMCCGYSTVYYDRYKGSWVWMIDADRLGQFGSRSVSPLQIVKDIKTSGRY